MQIEQHSVHLVIVHIPPRRTNLDLDRKLDIQGQGGLHGVLDNGCYLTDVLCVDFINEFIVQLKDEVSARWRRERGGTPPPASSSQRLLAVQVRQPALGPEGGQCLVSLQHGCLHQVSG